MACPPELPLTDDSMTSAAALRVLDHRLEAAQRVLESEPEPEQAAATTLLYEVEVCLTELVTTLSDTTMAKRLIGLRDALSSHLLAASTCERGELPPSVVVRLLRNGADQARRGIRGTVAVDADRGALAPAGQR